MKIAIISAMTEELSSIVEKYDVIKLNKINNQQIYSYSTRNNLFYFLTCGIGKINATLTTCELLNTYDIDLVINIGTSGGLHPNLQVGDVVIANKLSFHDVDVTAFGYEIGAYPGEDRYVYVNENVHIDNIIKNLFKNVHKGTVVTGDQFINKNELKEKIIKDFADVYAVEMESCAIVRSCQFKGVDIYVARTISDLAHESASVDFDTYLTEVSAKFCKLVEEIDGKREITC